MKKIIKKIYVTSNRLIEKILSSYYFSGLKIKSIIMGAKINIGTVGVVGNPVITFRKNSVLHIGNGSALVSKQYFNPVGLYKRTNIRLLNRTSKLVIGEKVGMSGTTICCGEKIVIDDGVGIGANCTILDTDFHNFFEEFNIDAPVTKPVHIQKNVKLAMNVTVLKGVTIGENSIIAANSLVVKNIPSNCLAGGNPAEVIKHFEVTNVL